MHQYERIKLVLKHAGRPLAAHEFDDISLIIDGKPGEQSYFVNGRQFIGGTEATLARRLREMRGLGVVVAHRRPDKAFVEYALVNY